MKYTRPIFIVASAALFAFTPLISFAQYYGGAPAYPPYYNRPFYIPPQQIPPSQPTPPAEPRSQCIALTRVIWLGATDQGNGGDVSRLQAFLRQAGAYNGPISGQFDRATDEALYMWQISRGLQSKGNEPHFKTSVDTATMDLIRELTCTYRPSGTVPDPSPWRADDRAYAECRLVYDQFGNRIPRCGNSVTDPLPLTSPPVTAQTNHLLLTHAPTITRHGALPRQCVVLSRHFWQGATDRETGGEVTKLRNYLQSIYGIVDGEYDRPGSFGPATEAMLVEWQRENNVTPRPIFNFPTMVDDATISALQEASCDFKNDGGFSTCVPVLDKYGRYIRSRCYGHQRYTNDPGQSRQASSGQQLPMQTNSGGSAQQVVSSPAAIRQPQGEASAQVQTPPQDQTPPPQVQNPPPPPANTNRVVQPGAQGVALPKPKPKPGQQTVQRATQAD